jgi:hypothetical protein
VVESQEVCIALLFMGIGSEHQVGIGGNLGGLGSKETRLVEVIYPGYRLPPVTTH